MTMMKKVVFVVLMVLVLNIMQIAAVVNNSTLITRVPMIMSHDAASGYLGSGLVDGWTKTQSVGIADQLGCGSRAFDARPQLKDGKLGWHHGPIFIDYSFQQSVQDVIAWLAKNPTELAIFVVTDCDGTGCADSVSKVLSAANVTSISNCSDLSTLTLGDAIHKGVLASGGSMLAIRDDVGDSCSQMNYDPTVTCSGYMSTASSSSKGFYACWKTDKTKDIPVNHMFKYLDSVAVKGLSDSVFNQAQAIWQESTDAIVIGTLRESSLLKDETNSGLNAMLTASITAKRWQSNISFLEVNNVCDGGIDLLAAIKKSYY